MGKIRPGGQEFLKNRSHYYQKAIYQTPGRRRNLLFRYFHPEGFDQDPDRKYPLILWLHGMYGRGNDNTHQLVGGGNHHGPAWLISDQIQGKLPSIVLAPQCPRGKFWVDFVRLKSGDHLEMVKDLLQEYLHDPRVDLNRIYCVGQSMGGFATWAMLGEVPGTFAAALPIAGGGNAKYADTIADIPVWAFHGEKDKIVRPWRSRRMVKMVRKAGGIPFYTEFPDMPHNIWQRVFSTPGLAEWLLKHQLSQPKVTDFQRSDSTKLASLIKAS